MHINLMQLARAIPLVAVLGPAEAHAEAFISCPGGAATGGPYYDPCDMFDGWTEVTLSTAGAIPIDGVLVLQGLFHGPQPAPETIVLTVTTDDVPLAGAVEATEFPGVVIWRPSAPWTAGATYAISGAASNADADGDCIKGQLPIAGEVTIDTDPASPLTPVELSGVETIDLVPAVSLTTMACCAGASPMVLGGGCESEGSVQFDPAKCAPTSGAGYLSLTLTGTAAASGPREQQVLYVLRAPGNPDSVYTAPMFGLVNLVAPQCATIDAVDLGTGETTPGVEKCFGEASADQLGPQVLDPAATLSCDLFTCAVNDNGDQWDQTMCSALDPNDTPTSGATGSGGSEGSSDDSGGQDGDKVGCACDGAGGSGPGVLALAGLVLVARRRRR